MILTIISIIIFLSFTPVFLRAIKKELPTATVIPFILNFLLFLILLKTITASHQINQILFITFLMLITLVWAMIVISPKSRWIKLAQIPYLLMLLLLLLMEFWGLGIQNYQGP